MIRTTPFHPRLSELNTRGSTRTGRGTLSPLRYTHAPKHEYFAVRNSVGVFDTSPLYKYRDHRARTPSGCWPARWSATSDVPAGPGAVHRRGATTAAS